MANTQPLEKKLMLLNPRNLSVKKAFNKLFYSCIHKCIHELCSVLGRNNKEQLRLDTDYKVSWTLRMSNSLTGSGLLCLLREDRHLQSIMGRGRDSKQLSIHYLVQRWVKHHHVNKRIGDKCMVNVSNRTDRQTRSWPWENTKQYGKRKRIWDQDTHVEREEWDWRQAHDVLWHTCDLWKPPCEGRALSYKAQHR